MLLCCLYSQLSAAHRDLHSFPTRRSSDLLADVVMPVERVVVEVHLRIEREQVAALGDNQRVDLQDRRIGGDERVVQGEHQDRKSTRLNSSHSQISYAVFCLKKKKNKHRQQ